MAVKTNNLEAQAKKILKMAKEKGTTTNFFFVTTFKRYQVQMNIMAQLEREIAAEGPVVRKEYVKGRANSYTNPAITEYNKTATAANGTVTTLIKILDSFTEEEKKSSKFQDLINAINNTDEDDE